MIGYIWARESNQDDVEVYSLKSQFDACREAAATDGVPVTAEREFRAQFSGRDFDANPRCASSARCSNATATKSR